MDASDIFTELKAIYNDDHLSLPAPRVGGLTSADIQRVANRWVGRGRQSTS
jgi:hypothetical protein